MMLGGQFALEFMSNLGLHTLGYLRWNVLLEPAENIILGGLQRLTCAPDARDLFSSEVQLNFLHAVK